MSLSKSVLIVFAGVALVVGLSSLAYRPDARMQVLLFGGNVSFLAMLIGWYIGIMFKPVST
jgi:putative Mn2+ efflux pump MntP